MTLNLDSQMRSVLPFRRLRAILRFLQMPIECAFFISLAVWNAAAANSFTTLYDFCPQKHCRLTYGGTGLIADQVGNLYGTSTTDGSFESGTIFELSFDTNLGQWVYSDLHDFCSAAKCTDGAFPRRLIIDAAGNLYGMAEHGGAQSHGKTSKGNGIVFELTADRTYKILYKFCAHGKVCPDGANPGNSLLYAGASTGAPYDGHSPLYGQTISGGQEEEGVAFILTPKGEKWKYSVFHDFEAGGDFMVMDVASNYFWLSGGGAGLLMKMNQVGGMWVETILHAFCSAQNCADGTVPTGQLALDANGAVYGVTVDGGANNSGALYKFDTLTAQYEVLHDFCSNSCLDGAVPEGGVALNQQGDLFGTTLRGGTTGNGSIFEFSNPTFQTLYSFCAQDGCADGGWPWTPVAIDNSGNMFGTTSKFGGNNCGTVFAISASTGPQITKQTGLSQPKKIDRC